MFPVIGRYCNVLSSLCFQLLGGGIFGIVQWLRADSESLVALFNGLPADLGASRTFLSSIYGLGFAIGMMTFTNSWVGFAGAAGKNRGFLYWVSQSNTCFKLGLLLI